MYRIILTKKAIKDLEKLEDNIKMRIGEKLKFLSDNPYLYAKKLTNPEIGTYRFRIGDYRVIFDINENDIVILRIGHRKEIYK